MLPVSMLTRLPLRPRRWTASRPLPIQSEMPPLDELLSDED